jgi:hypothetical protein
VLVVCSLTQGFVDKAGTGKLDKAEEDVRFKAPHPDGI